MKGVLFDLDNTLAERDQAFAFWARRFAGERLGLGVPAEIEAAVALLVELDAGGRGPKAAMFATLKSRYPSLLDEVDLLLPAFRDGLLTHLPPLAPGVVGLLGSLAERGMPWGIVSNGSAAQLRKIRQLGLEDTAACIVISEIVGVRKPDPEIFCLAAREINLAPDAILFVGDHPVADIVGAARVGMETAWLRRGRDWPLDLAATPPDYILDTLADLSRLPG